MIGKFCEVFGDSVKNKILEEFLENSGKDVAVSQICKLKNTSKPTTYEEIKKLEYNGIIVKSRIIGKTQLYELNKQNLDVQLLEKTFMECLKTVVKEYKRDNSKTIAETHKQKIETKI